jgi:hypothetical protein
VQIAVLNRSTRLSNNDVCFLVQACAEQLVEFCAAWGLDPWAVGFYATAIGLPADDIYVFEYVDKLDVEGAEAYHSVDALGRPYGRMLPPSDKLDATDLSHEILETMGDPTADRWVKMPSGSELAVEVCDPCQGDSYSVPVEVLNETRQIKLSNYVLGSFFDPQGKAPYDRMGTISAPFGMSPGWYEAILDPSGNEHDVFARLAGDRASAAAKLHDPGSRILRRLRRKR